MKYKHLLVGNIIQDNLIMKYETFSGKRTNQSLCTEDYLIPTFNELANFIFFLNSGLNYPQEYHFNLVYLDNSTKWNEINVHQKYSPPPYSCFFSWD